MFLKRSDAPEIMDDFSITDNRITKALKELKIINSFLGGKSVSEKGFSYLDKHSMKSFRVLDAGSGDSNTLSNLVKKKNIELLSLDKNIGICKYIKSSKSDAKVICGDAMHIPFRTKSVHIMHASLFIHHFNAEQLKIIISEFLRVSSGGIIINDLRRSIAALAGIKILTQLFSRSRMVRHDGPLSVKKGFIKQELKDLLEQYKVQYIIKRKWAFRWLIIILIN